MTLYTLLAVSTAVPRLAKHMAETNPNPNANINQFNPNPNPNHVHIP